MKRRAVLLVAVGAVMLTLAAVGSQKKPDKLLLLEWAAKASAEMPPAAVLIEMGLKDTQPSNWSGQATVRGAKVVHREGYRFRTGDTLIEPDSWKASSHRGLRVPRGQPQIVRAEGPATVGVVLHLADVEENPTIVLEGTGDWKERVTLPLKDVLAGHPIGTFGGGTVVRRISTATPVVTAKTEDDFPAACYGPDGTLWVAYISYTVKDESRRIEAPQLKQQPDNFKAFYTPEFGDQLFVKRYRNGKWSEPIAITGPKEDLVRCAIAAESDGTVWVAYSANRRGRHDIYTRTVTWPQNQMPVLGDEQNLTENARTGGRSPFVNPSMCTDSRGKIKLVSQCLSPVVDETRLKVFLWWGPNDKGGGLTKGNANLWNAVIAAGPDPNLAAAFDAYEPAEAGWGGDYDVHVSLLFYPKSVTNPVFPLEGSRFEARPSICFDPQGRLWIAYEEGPERWGKDYGALAPDKGNPLYNERSVRVVCVENGKLMKPAAELPTSKYEPPHIPFDPLKTQKFEQGTRYAYPKIGIDGRGRVWLTYRQKFGSRYSSHPGSYWLTFARRLDGDHWSQPIELHHSDGLLDHRPVLLPHAAGGLIVIHNTDGRYTTPESIDNDIYMSYVDLPGEPAAPKLVPQEPVLKDRKLVQQAEKEHAAVERIRKYRVEAGGKKYRLLRGEFHRHTEMSWDGGPDGSLDDMFRYAFDAAELDWIGNGDHDSGAGREYSWWLIQKFSDAYHIPDHFTPMFTYERSVNYPHGHRNCVFAKRGVRTLPRLAEPDPDKRVGAVHADDTKMLYRYLHELDGVCASHTSATSMGTDWRDHDSQVEPFVEIYQGDRMSYEYEEAPRAGYDPKSGKDPANVAGWFPKGFINHALAKGHRLGFESSSDHWSTHISYCVVLAEKNSREAILDAMKRRHCYGATDDIILDVRSGEHLMGDEFQTREAPTLQIHVLGTSPVARIDIHKDGEVVETLKPAKKDHQATWTDPKPTPGVHYYYVRIVQADGELAWASPLWIDYSKR